MAAISWVLRTESAQIATSRDVVLVRFTEPPPLSAFAAYRRALDRVIEAVGPQRAALVHLAEVGPASRDRSALERELKSLMRDYDGRIIAASVAIMTQGFLNAMVRSVASMAIRAIRPRTQIALVDEVRAGAEHIARVRRDGEPTELVRLITQFRDECMLDTTGHRRTG
jgi:hypothetical protein